MKYWLVSTIPDNFKYYTEKLNFSYIGFPNHSLKTVQKMNINDRVIFYISQISKIGAVVTITGDRVESIIPEQEMNNSWKIKRASNPNIILTELNFIDIRKHVVNLAFIKNKITWGAYFQGSLRIIPKEDFIYLENMMKSASGF